MKIEQHERFQKMFIDNFYLLDIKNNKYDFIFKISGSTQNIYTIKILKNYECNHVFCDCYDMKKWAANHGVFCKHILFVIFKILKLFNYTNILSDISVDSDGEQFLQKKTLSKDYIEVISVFIDIFNYEDNEIINKDYITKFEQLENNRNNKIEKLDKFKNTNSEYCLICFEDFDKETDLESFQTKCNNCIGIFHTECLQKWLDFNNTCPYCRCVVKRKSDYTNLFDNL